MFYGILSARKCEVYDKAMYFTVLYSSFDHVTKVTVRHEGHWRVDLRFALRRVAPRYYSDCGGTFTTSVFVLPIPI